MCPQVFINTPDGEPKIFVATGANRGLGYGIVENLAQRVENCIIYITALEEADGREAVDTLKESLGKNLKCELRSCVLDILSEESCQTFFELMQMLHGKVDVLINNAGLGFQLENIKTLEEKIFKGRLSMDVNYYGTKRITQYLLPLMPSGARVINICSQFGIVKKYAKKHVLRLRHAMSDRDIDDVVEQYMRCVAEDTCTENGFHESPYRVSKAAEIALTVLYSKLYKDFGIKFYACCPGSVSTLMTLNKGDLTIQQGADTPAWLATDPDAPDGVLVHERKPVDWY